MQDFLSPPGAGERDVSPFSSPYSNLNASPLAARRSSLEERRRPAAKYDPQQYLGSTANNVGLSDGQAHNEDEEDEEEEEGDDHVGESSPLLPIFSAEHLGILPIKQS